MPRLLVASSPVEIEAKAEEAGFSGEQRDVALGMFHALTARVGRAAIALDVTEAWPNHHFYFGIDGDEMSALLDGLRGRADILDVTSDAKARGTSLAGLYVVAREANFVGILVGHRNLEGLRSAS